MNSLLLQYALSPNSLISGAIVGSAAADASVAACGPASPQTHSRPSDTVVGNDRTQLRLGLGFSGGSDGS